MDGTRDMHRTLGLDDNGTEPALHGTEVAVILYTLFESAKLAGVGPYTYLKAAISAALQGVEIPLPHEVAGDAAAHAAAWVKTVASEAL